MKRRAGRRKEALRSLIVDTQNVDDVSEYDVPEQSPNG